MWSIVDRSVVMGRMTVHNNITEMNTFFFILQVAIHNTVTIQKRQHSIHLVHIAKDNAIYTTFNIHRAVRSTYHVPRMPPAVTAADRRAAGTDKQRVFTCHLLHVGHSWRM